jgi:hypothetical protein
LDLVAAHRARAVEDEGDVEREALAIGVGAERVGEVAGALVNGGDELAAGVGVVEFVGQGERGRVFLAAGADVLRDERAVLGAVDAGVGGVGGVELARPAVCSMRAEIWAPSSTPTFVAGAVRSSW